MLLNNVLIILFAICLANTSSSKEISQKTGNTPQESLLNVSAYSELLNEKTQVEAQSESEITVTPRHALKFNTSLRLDKTYETLGNDSLVDLDLLNDSAEVEDTIINESSIVVGNSGYEEISLPKHWDEKSSSNTKQNEPLENIFKVPKFRNKKTLSESSVKMTKRLTPENLSMNMNNEGSHIIFQNYFHAFSSIYDHFLWNLSSFNTATRSCLSDMNTYLSDLKAAKSWALKASDASGRYRGLFYFNNNYWLGSKQYCYEINIEKTKTDEFPAMKFFVLKMLVTLTANQVSCATIFKIFKNTLSENHFHFSQLSLLGIKIIACWPMFAKFMHNSRCKNIL